MLAAPALRLVKTCTASPRTVGKDTWLYSGAGPGTVTTGLVASQTTTRFNVDTGASLGDIQLFNAVYDPTTFALSRISKTRDDGAQRKVTITYDPFALAAVSVRIDTTNADGSKPPTMVTTSTVDPVTLMVTSTTDANGTKADHTFDGLGRILLSSITPPGGTSAVLSSMSYVGFANNETGGRRVKQKLFADAVAAGSVATAAGRTGSTFLDALGRPLRTEIALGADYPGQTIVSGSQLYDRLEHRSVKNVDHLDHLQRCHGRGSTQARSA